MKGILVNTEYCTGCRSCEVSCKTYLGLPEGEFGIKLAETGPWEYSDKEKGVEKWEWTWTPILTKACNLCVDRTEKGKIPLCVQHCQAYIMYFDEIDELVKKMDDGTRWTLLTAHEAG